MGGLILSLICLALLLHIANLPNLKLSLDMNDMLRVFTEEDLSEFFYYQEGSE